MTTLIIEDPIFLRHLVPTGHPERPDRVEAIGRALAADRFTGLVRQTSPIADIGVLIAAHPEKYIDEIRRAVPDSGLAQVEVDTWLSPESYTVALHSAGAASMAVDPVMSGRAANAFCASASARPPCRARPVRWASACSTTRSSPPATRNARMAAERVAIVDWDVHHGNGTQAIVWADPSVLYCSTHQMPLYPGTGAPSETGCGNIVNCRLAPGDGGTGFETAFDERDPAGPRRLRAGPHRHLRRFRCPLARPARRRSTSARKISPRRRWR